MVARHASLRESIRGTARTSFDTQAVLHPRKPRWHHSGSLEGTGSILFSFGVRFGARQLEVSVQEFEGTGRIDRVRTHKPLNLASVGNE